MDRLSRPLARPLVSVLAALAAVALLTAPAHAAGSNGGVQYGQASQSPVPNPGGVDPTQPVPDPLDPLTDPTTPDPTAPLTPVDPPQLGQVAKLLSTGVAIAPIGAPIAVRRIIAAANRIATTKYVWGGGHRRWDDRGYDCSGSVSFALHGAGLLESPLVSGDFARWGAAGAGSWVTIYANRSHVYMVVAGLRFDTSGQKEAGTRWQLARRSNRGFSVRHPDVL